MKFKLVSQFKPTGDQPAAIKKLSEGMQSGFIDQVLLGVTGSGKTFTIANVVEKFNLPTLVISHNKTLAAQLYQEFRDFFPQNAVSYFVSYYDFYQPEAYIPQSNTYIEKEAQVNELIDKLRLQATANILSRRDTLVVSSVSCIYNIGKPENYQEYTIALRVGEPIHRMQFFTQLVTLQYTQSQFDFKRATFRDRGETIDVYLSYEDSALRLVIENDKIVALKLIDPLTGVALRSVLEFTIYPAKHFLTGGKNWDSVFSQIKRDLEEEVAAFEKQGKLVEADRLERRVRHDLEMIREVGYVNGIENYSRYFDGRAPGQPPYSLLNYFNKAYGEEWLLVVDESHMSVPQLRGMYNGDRARKTNLINYGFRLNAAYDNRPLTFAEFLPRTPRRVYVSATPDEWEVSRSQQVAEQLVRPTGITDPEIEIRPVEHQVTDLVKEIEARAAKKERTLVTTLTKRIAEDLSLFLKEKGIRAEYLHSDIKTLERSDVLDSLRSGKFDALIGINLLREGLDLPEVTLVAILDADKEGFLRSKTSLIQTMGRAARNVGGTVIMYSDTMTRSIKAAVAEVNRRRHYQLKYNKAHNITPHTIQKPIRERLVLQDAQDMEFYFGGKNVPYTFESLNRLLPAALTPYDKKKLAKELKRRMRKEAENLNFELAAQLRDAIKRISSN